MPTEQGHLDQERKGLQSQVTSHLHDDPFPPHTLIRSHERYTTIINPYNSKHVQKAYMDSTGRFPHISSRGNQYLVVMYDFDSNAVVFEPIKTRQSKEILNAFRKCEQKIANNGIIPKMYILNNEASGELKNSLLKNKQQYELVPSNIHRCNAAEKAIRTFKNHLLSGLASCDKKFPIQEWDRLLNQCEITLNLFRNSRINPKLSAWAAIQEVFDFNKSPMAPPGTQILIHSKPDKRSSWAYHGQPGWYVGPAPEHYRCVTCYLPKTHKEIISDTVKFIPNQVPIPNANIDDQIRNSLQTLTNMLSHKAKAYPPGYLSETNKQAIITLANLFNRDLTPVTSYAGSSEGAKEKEIAAAPTHHQLPKAPPKSTTKVQPMPDEDFDKLLKSISKYKESSPSLSKCIPGNKTCTLPPTPVLQYNIPTPKSSTSRAPTNHHQYPSTTIGKPRLVTPNHPSTNTRQLTLQHMVANHFFNKINHIFDIHGKRQSLDELIKGPDAATWQQATSNELGRLAQGVCNTKGNDVIDFIYKSDVPAHKKVTYANMVCDFRPLKSEPHRVSLTVGGDRLDYDKDAASPAASLLETKLLLNSVISQSAYGCRFMTLDIKDFFCRQT